MKKIVLAIASLLVLLSFTESKTYRVELTIEQWQTVVEVMENSNAPHQQVKAAQQWVIPQLQNQLKDTTVKK